MASSTCECGFLITVKHLEELHDIKWSMVPREIARLKNKDVERGGMVIPGLQRKKKHHAAMRFEYTI